MLYEDLQENYNAVCEKNAKLKEQRDKAVSRANDEIAKTACLEIELAGLREELKQAYHELSESKHESNTDD